MSKSRGSTFDLTIDWQNSSMGKELVDGCGNNGLIYHRQTVNRSFKTYVASCAKWLSTLAIIAVLMSIPWEFMRLYQKAVAGRASQIIQGAPPECSPESMSLYESLKSLLRSQFSWTHARSPCHDYYYALLVDPLWEVTPVTVLSSIFTKCFLHPLELTCASLGHCLQLFFSEIPAQWQPLFLLIAIIIAIVFLLVLFGYRLSVPLLLRLEPKSPVNNLSYVRSSTYPNGFGQSNRASNGSHKKSRYVSDSEKMSIVPASDHDNLNNHNQPSEISYLDSRTFNRQVESTNKNLMYLSSAPRISSQGQSSSLTDSKKTTISLVPNVAGKSVSRTQNSKVNTKELTRTKKTKTTATSVAEAYSFIRHVPAKSVAQLKPRKKSAVNKRNKLDTLWTPSSEDYELSD